MSAYETEKLVQKIKIYEFILNQLNEGIHVIDEEGVSIIYNEKMSEIEAMKKESVLGKRLLDVFTFTEEQESTLLRALQHGEITQNMKQTYFNAKGRQITTINNAFPIMESGRTIAALELANDITRVEHMLRENFLKDKDTRYVFESIIGDSAALREVIAGARRAARTSSSVLIVGETGTGKELFAQSLHNDSTRATGPFISQNCAALPEHLIEGLLFGTHRGAFTGAIERPGLFEQARDGTLLLDEINSMSPPLQAKLLRALQEKKIRRIGGTKDIDIDVRIMATMNEDPVDAIAGNRLRKDLYYRLGVVTLFIPPLRERKDDIEPLAWHFIQKYNRLFDMNIERIHPDVLETFHAYSWPGNVRELEHAIEGAMNFIADETEITMEHLPHHIRRRLIHFSHGESGLAKARPLAGTTTGTTGEAALPYEGEAQDLKSQLTAFEKKYIGHVLQKNRSNVSRAARELGISRQSLQYRMRKYGIHSASDDGSVM
ncbi:sigma 54-interacting transcriptional regulator [Aneurinibacillus sp. BA2021]|nr:sigma 54-interacting transcriptional regulator [Aneurinibacillus sp. BA2021]